VARVSGIYALLFLFGALTAETVEIEIQLDHGAYSNELTARRRSNEVSCNNVDYNVENEDGNCFVVKGLSAWNQEYLEYLCKDGGKTDKNSTATVCEVDGWTDEESLEYNNYLKLAILNQMYGTSTVPVGGVCKEYCMWEPFHVGGDDAIGFIWRNNKGCWELYRGSNNPTCNGGDRKEWTYVWTKKPCVGATCVSYGDPHVYGFTQREVPMQFSIGDYVLYNSETLRIDVRLREYYTNSGDLWNRVTGVHATAIEVIDPEAACPVKLEIYSKYQTESEKLRFLLNETDVSWEDLEAYLNNPCEEVCSDLWEVDEDENHITIVFADKAMITLMNVENMHALFLTVPTDTVYSDTFLVNEKQLCTSEFRPLNCDDDKTIFTYYDWNSDEKRYMNCDETPDPQSGDGEDCDLNIEEMGEEVCTECDAPCVIPSLVESCKFDICYASGVLDAWNQANETLAKLEAQSIAESYCHWTKEEIAEKPWLCPENPTKRPTGDPVVTPTWSPSPQPTPEPTTQSPTPSPTKRPTVSPTKMPTSRPTGFPTRGPSDTPSEFPTNLPTRFPTRVPTKRPTVPPTESPTAFPTNLPTNVPTNIPTQSPTVSPTLAPTDLPTWSPTGYQNCPFIAYKNRTCNVVDYIPKELPESGFDAGLQNCVEECFREGSEWFHYLHGSGTCHCVVGRCVTPLIPSSQSTFKILPCDLTCDEVTSEEWWGQEPTSEQRINGVVAKKTVKGIRFTSEIDAEIFMIGIDLKLTDDYPPQIPDSSLLIRSRLYHSGKNNTVSSGFAELPAFVDGYDGQFGNLSKIFVRENIRSMVPYTVAFEFVGGLVDLMVSENTHYYHDGDIAHELFAVRGNAEGVEPDIVDLRAPHVVFCYRLEQCVEKKREVNDAELEAECPNGFGTTGKTSAHTNCLESYSKLLPSVKSSLANIMFEDCESTCIYDADWPEGIQWLWFEPRKCWGLNVNDVCSKEPVLENVMIGRSADFCANMSMPTPIPTVPPTDHGRCDDPIFGEVILLAIDSAYEILDEICSKINTSIVKVDGGYIYGDSCTAEKTDADYSYDYEYCARLDSEIEYCDFADLLFTPNFDVDPDATLTLVSLTDLWEFYWEDAGVQSVLATHLWGLDISMIRSMELNAIGIYIKDFFEEDTMSFYVQDEFGGTLHSGALGHGVLSEAHWYFVILENSNGDGLRLEANTTYRLLWAFPQMLSELGNAFAFPTQVRGYSDITFPFHLENSFYVNNFVTESAGGFTTHLKPFFSPFVNAKFCRAIPTPSPTVLPTLFPTHSPTDACLNIHMELSSYDADLIDLPSWFDIFAGNYLFYNETENGLFVYRRDTNRNFKIFHSGSEWKIYDESGEYMLELAHVREAALYYPPLDNTSVWQYENDQSDHVSGWVNLFLECDSFYPPTLGPTVSTGPTESPTYHDDDSDVDSDDVSDDVDEACAILDVSTDDDEYNGIYYILRNGSEYLYRNGKHQWYKDNQLKNGHIFWMNEDSSLWPNSWIITTAAGYLTSNVVETDIYPKTASYLVYLPGSVNAASNYSVEVLCATKPPTFQPSPFPTPTPTEQPSPAPTPSPSLVPSPSPTQVPSSPPTLQPTIHPTLTPTDYPVASPTVTPSEMPTVVPTYPDPCSYLELTSLEFDEFDGDYSIVENNYGKVYRNRAPQWKNSKTGYIIFYLSDGLFSNRWTIQASDESTPRESAQDYYIISPELGDIEDSDELNIVPTGQLWQVFSADTWHMIGDFFINLKVDCADTIFPSNSPSRAPTPAITVNYPCIYLNSSDSLDGFQGWSGVYTKITTPELKNGKVHYSGPLNNELYWMDAGVFAQRWILACTNGTILVYEDNSESENIPNKENWQQIGFSGCVGHCVDIGYDINITVTNLLTCAPSLSPTPVPSYTPAPTTLSPTKQPTLKPTVMPTTSPSPSPSTIVPSDMPTILPTSAPTALPTVTNTPEPTDHPTHAPTDSPTTYPTHYCECLTVATKTNEIAGHFTMLDDRNSRFQWEDGKAGWTLYWLENGLFAGNWIFQGDDHDYYWAHPGTRGLGTPPYRGNWQKFRTDGYNLASDEFLNITLDCDPCDNTFSPTSKPTNVPSFLPTSSPTCSENYVSMHSCCGEEEFEGIYSRQDLLKNGKHYYVNFNGYTLFYVHDGLFENHWVTQSPEHDYFYLIEHSESGDEPVLNVEQEWKVYRGASFSYISLHNITVSCSNSMEPTRTPTGFPSPPPTTSPSPSPSSPPTIYPTLSPTFMPSTMPTPLPSPLPSSVPTRSPTTMPTTFVPSKTPSMMPSPSPTYAPTTKNPTKATDQPSIVPTISPTLTPSSYTVWCNCITVNSSDISGFDSVYVHNGLSYNQHFIWETVDEFKIYWDDSIRSDISWIIEGEGSLFATFEEDDAWLVTPPIDAPRIWTLYGEGVTASGSDQWFTLSCTTCEPTSQPTLAPTTMPSLLPSPSPSMLPTTYLPTSFPSMMPSPAPTELPTTSRPTQQPSAMPSPSPSSKPSVIPTSAPTALPTTSEPSNSPSLMPSLSPTAKPSLMPTPSPTKYPTFLITDIPSQGPSPSPSVMPSLLPTPTPSNMPSSIPTESPTRLPTTQQPSDRPSAMPSPSPSKLPSTSVPSPMPSMMPSPSPSPRPSIIPSPSPTEMPLEPTLSPSPSPTQSPTLWCSCIQVNSASVSELTDNYVASGRVINQHYHWESKDGKQIYWSYEMLGSAWLITSSSLTAAVGEDSVDSSIVPPIGTELWNVYLSNAINSGATEMKLTLTCGECITVSPTSLPTTRPTESPSIRPTLAPSPMPSVIPSPSPTALPTKTADTNEPSLVPTRGPSGSPTVPAPTLQPSLMPSPSPSTMPSSLPTTSPTDIPTFPKPTPMPSAMPSPSPSSLPITRIPSPSPSLLPSPAPSPSPSSLPTPSPTKLPTLFITDVPSELPSPSPSQLPTTSEPTKKPTQMPSPVPTLMPSLVPTPSPTKLPTTLEPTPVTPIPTVMPTSSPTALPTTRIPSPSPSVAPTPAPSPMPSSLPTAAPTKLPTTPNPSQRPSAMPSPSPSHLPSVTPTPSPTKLPTTPIPSLSPSQMPSPSPTALPSTSIPSLSPSVMPSPAPSSQPSTIPTTSPTKLPTTPVPSNSPSVMPSPAPSSMPSAMPTPSPTMLPTTPIPSSKPTLMPSPSPSKLPTKPATTTSPSVMPSLAPSPMPSVIPTASPTKLPTTRIPSASPSQMPSPSPSKLPTTTVPSNSPSLMPSPAPSPMPSTMPTPAPSNDPTTPPTKSPTFLDLVYCQCIKGNSSDAFAMIYYETGLQKNNHWLWLSEEDKRIYWEDSDQLPSSWILEGNDGTTAMFNDNIGQWVLTPPIGQQEWLVYYLNDNLGNRMISLTCVECPETGAPTNVPSSRPSLVPTSAPSPMPSVVPTPSPTAAPSQISTPSPSLMPSPSPTLAPQMPTLMPSPSPTDLPTTPIPSLMPSMMPSPSPSELPTTRLPSQSPSLMPTPAPSSKPSLIPTSSPTNLPTTLAPSITPSFMPSPSPTLMPTNPIPSPAPSLIPSPAPSPSPSLVPTLSPTKQPSSGSSKPSPRPSLMPSPSPSPMPSALPSPTPTKLPTTLPPTGLSDEPTIIPTPSPTSMPSLLPTESPTDYPTFWCRCITVNANDSASLSGTYMASGHVINQHYHWETYDDQYIYFTDNDEWAIVSNTTVVAIYASSIKWLNTPPIQLDTWSVWNGYTAVEKFITLSCDTCEPTPSPTIAPSVPPTTPLPTNSPSLMPSPSPSPLPSAVPSPSPTRSPTVPTPSSFPSLMPSPSPSLTPIVPTTMPSPSPTAFPTTSMPTSLPSLNPSPSPTKLPTTAVPSPSPSAMPSPSPSLMPSTLPTPTPSQGPTTPVPSPTPSFMPSPSPSRMPTTLIPSPSPSLVPTPAPSPQPSSLPSPSPTGRPTAYETFNAPSTNPSTAPSPMPSTLPSPSPSGLPTLYPPSASPSLMPSPSPSPMPTVQPTQSPIPSPTSSENPTRSPDPFPTSMPTLAPSWAPTMTYMCIFIDSTSAAINGTYTRLPERIGGKAAWFKGQVELYFSDGGIFDSSWVIHNPDEDEYLVLEKEQPYKGDSYPPMGVPTNWQQFTEGVVPNLQYLELMITYQTTCNPTVSPTQSPSFVPTVLPTEGYVCVIITWDIENATYSPVPIDYYGAYYYRSTEYSFDNDFAKFPIYPTTRNSKPIFTKKRNDDSISFFLVSDGPATEDTWVIDSDNHNFQLVSSIPNEGSDLPYSFDMQQQNLTKIKYAWDLWSGDILVGSFELEVAMSRSLDTCEMFDTNTPTEYPTGIPTRVPTMSPSIVPTPSPSPMPTVVPSPAPSPMPSTNPSPSPTARPTSQEPTSRPTSAPTQYPTLYYQCINITALDVANNDYNGVYSIQSDTRNGRVWFTDGNTGFDLYYVDNAVMISHAWILEGVANDHLSLFDVDIGTWTKFGQNDEVPPYGTFTWKKFAAPPQPSRYEQIELHLEPLENCIPTRGPTEAPTDFPTISTPSPTTPYPTIMPSPSPSLPPSTIPSGTPTANPTEVCYVLVVETPDEPGGTIFEGSYIAQSVFRNRNLQWFNSDNGYTIFFVDDEWLPSSWVFQGDPGLDELAVFDEGTDGHPNTVEEFSDGEDWYLFYWGHDLQKRNETVKVKIFCVDTLPPTSIPTPVPSPMPSIPPTPLPSPMPSFMPSASPSSMPSVVPSASPSPMPSVIPTSSPTLIPTVITDDPTLAPTSVPSSYPTFECPCIVINSTAVEDFSGMYQQQDTLYNGHNIWINLDNNFEITWADEAAFEEYWVIGGNSAYAVREKNSDEWEATPPIGLEVWTFYMKGRGFISGGIDQWVELDCTTCTPTPSPTPLPTNLSTPSPTTPSPSVMPSLSPSPLPSAVPTSSPTTLPTTLDPTPETDIPSLLPTVSPTIIPTTLVPSQMPSLIPTPSPSTMPSTLPTPSPTANPVVPTSMPSPGPTMLPTTPIPSPTPSFMPSPAPTAMPSQVPTPSPSKLPTTRIPTSSPSVMPSPSPSPMPSLVPSPSPSPSPSLMPSPSPTNSPTDTCLCLEVQDPDETLSDFVGLYRYLSRSSPNSNKWMWERMGDNTQELIYFSKFGSAAGRWVIKGSIYGEWAETSADDSEPKPPESASWLINVDAAKFYHSLLVNCSQCEETPAPTPDPTESPTEYPTSLNPTKQPTPSPSRYCRVLNITDVTNGFYTGIFEMQVLPYNGKKKWTDMASGESLFWVDSAMFEHEGPVENIWMIGYTEEEGDKDSHFIIYKDSYKDTVDENYPHIDSIDNWLEYTYNSYSNQNSSMLINCEETVMPTESPTDSPTHPFCLELFVWTCCDPVYTSLDGVYRAAAHRGGKDMYYNSNNGYYILYTNRGNDEDSTWAIRSEDEELIWVETTERNGPYPPFESRWNLMNHILPDLEVSVNINCTQSFSPSTFPTPAPTGVPTSKGTTLEPSPMPTAQPSNIPTDEPSQVPTAECTALVVVGQDGEVSKYDGTYARLDETKNGKTQWINYETGGDLYWIDRGIWKNTWMMRASDGEYLLLYDEETYSNHPDLDGEWMFPGREFILTGEMFHEVLITCTTQPPAPSPTLAPTLNPTCVGNAIHIEDPCHVNTTGGEYGGYYNAEYTQDGKNVYVRVDGKYEALYVSGDLYADNWMIRSHNSDICEEFWVVGGYNDLVIPPTDVFWEAYNCGCISREYKYKCNFRIRCMQTKAPIPTENPTSLPTPMPVDTGIPTSSPTSDPSPTPTADPTPNPTVAPTNAPSFKPTTGTPTQSPLEYECVTLELQPCGNTTGRTLVFTERESNQSQITANYYETKLYTEQKGYSFVAAKDMVMYEAGMAFVNLASYQSVTVRVFDSTSLIYESDYSLSGNGMTMTTGSPRGDYYTFKNMDVQLLADQKYTLVFVIHCPATQTSRAEYPLCAPHYETYSLEDFATGTLNVYSYGENYNLPTDSDLYAPFVQICYSTGAL
jgi:hypothetical protein